MIRKTREIDFTDLRSEWEQITEQEREVFKRAVAYEIKLAEGFLTKGEFEKFMLAQEWMSDMRLSLNDIPDKIYIELKRGLINESHERDSTEICA